MTARLTTFGGLLPWPILYLALTLVAGTSMSQTNPPAAASLASLLTPVAPGVFQVGKVRLDKNQRQVSFPAVVNMTEAMVEYLVVTPRGKTHESLLRSEVDPQHLHVAMLLLNARTAPPNSFPTNAAQPLPGEPLAIDLAWQVDGRTNRVSAGAWLLHHRDRIPMSSGVWVYNGSRMAEAKFLAQTSGSIVSLITDPEALVNNARPDRDDDELWEVHSQAVPPLDTPVEVTLSLKGKKP